MPQTQHNTLSRKVRLLLLLGLQNYYSLKRKHHRQNINNLITLGKLIVPLAVTRESNKLLCKDEEQKKKINADNFFSLKRLNCDHFVQSGE